MLSSFDTHSMASMSSVSSTYSLFHSLANKKKEKEQLSKHDNLIILILHFLVTSISIFCLIYEKNLNSEFEGILNIYKTTATLNRFTSSLIVHFISMICTNSGNGTCVNMFKQYISTFYDYQDLYNFSLAELNINIDYFSMFYSEFKLSIQAHRAYFYSQFFDQNQTTFHMVYTNNSFDSSYNIGKHLILVY